MLKVGRTHHSATWPAATCRPVIATIPEPAVCSPRLDLTPRVNLGQSVAPSPMVFAAGLTT